MNYTQEEQLVVDYAKLCGFEWLCKDADGDIWAYKEKPVKNDYINAWLMAPTGTSSIEINYPLSFLSWKDEEPYYIGD